MLFEHNRSYEARFLGREVLTAAVTSELLCRLVHQLPETAQDGCRCTVLCSASGLTVTRLQGSSLQSALRVPLNNILFCHVDKAKPEVTVWVVRAKEGEEGSVRPSNPPHSSSGQQVSQTGNGAGGSTVLSAYIYKCLNPSDAVGLFNVYNEMNRQAKLDKYRRNVEKKEDAVAPTGHYRDGSKDSDSDESHAGSNSSSGVSSGSNTSLAPAVTVVPATDSTDGNFIRYGTSPAWTSIADDIENYRRSFGALRPRDKEVRAAVLLELREKLRSRYAADDGAEVASRSSPKKSAVSPSDASSGSKQLASNRQRKPARIIEESATVRPVPTPKQEKRAPNTGRVAWTSSPGSDHPSPRVFPFSVGNMMRRLVARNTGGKGGTVAPKPPIQAPLWLLAVKGSVAMPPAMPVANHSPTRKFKSRKGPAPLPPQPNIPPRMVSNGVDPYFYLPPLPRTATTKGGRANTRTDVFVPVLPPAWIHHHRPKETTIPETPGGKDAKNGRAAKVPSNGDHQRRSSATNPKKKVLSVHGLSRFTRAYRRVPHGGGAFNRSSSITSRDSSSSESGPDGKLRSVMKKPKQVRDDNSPPELKKNVTFHAYATVQVLP